MPPQRNIYGIDAGLMIAAAQIFDFLELGGKVGYPIVAAIDGAVGWIPFFGQLIGTASLSAAGTFDEALTLPIVVLSYATMWMWFSMKRETPLSGEFLTRKMMMWMVCMLVGFTPLLNALPDITVWTIGNILFAQHQYKKKLLEYNKKQAQETARMENRRAELREEILAQQVFQNT